MEMKGWKWDKGKLLGECSNVLTALSNLFKIIWPRVDVDVLKIVLSEILIGK